MAITYREAVRSVKVKGKGKKIVKTDDVLAVLFGNDLLRGTNISLSLQDFLTWLLNQEVKNEDFGNMWYDYDVMIEKWNEFVTQR